MSVRAPAVALIPRLRLHAGDDIAIGPGKADLLRLIGETGSIAAAGRAMGMSYKRAWLLVGVMNKAFAEPLVTVSRGGNQRGGAELTATGQKVLAAYNRLLETLGRNREVARIAALLSPAAKPKSARRTARAKRSG
ncbi:MAG: LysR family transcriptional regulator [Bauldia sp.]|nr:LysR family transcriptional regulator [Bauldia sp.]